MITYLILSLLLCTGLITLYLYKDAEEDYTLSKMGGVDHVKNAQVRSVACGGFILFAILPSLTTLGIWYALSLLIIYSLFMFFYGWTLFDYLYNKRANHALDYLGSGGIDMRFKKLFGADIAGSAMMITKLIGLALTLAMFVYLLIILI